MKFYFALVTFFVFTAFACNNSSAQKITNVDPADFQEGFKKAHNKVILDVRTPGEFENGHIPGAQNMNVNSADFESEITKLDTTATIFVYCLAGGRSSNAADILAEKGFKNIVNLKSGYAKWNATGYPTEQGNTPKAKNKGISISEFESLTNAGDTLVLIDFSAAWCGPCKKIHAFIPEVVVEFKGKMNAHELDYDQNSELITALKLETVPYLKLYKRGVQVWEQKGAIEKEELKSAISTFL